MLINEANQICWPKYLLTKFIKVLVANDQVLHLQQKFWIALQIEGKSKGGIYENK